MFEGSVEGDANQLNRNFDQDFMEIFRALMEITIKTYQVWEGK
jgi:hypothetical protein